MRTSKSIIVNKFGLTCITVLLVITFGSLGDSTISATASEDRDSKLTTAPLNGKGLNIDSPKHLSGSSLKIDTLPNSNRLIANASSEVGVKRLFQENWLYIGLGAGVLIVVVMAFLQG